MNIKLKTFAAATAFAGIAMASAMTQASAAVLIDGTTAGLYNDGIGTVLNGTNPFMGNFLFPAEVGDPTFLVTPEPDLSAAAASLGDWLTTPATPGGTWSAGPEAIPATWAIEDETAIIYEINAGVLGLTNVTANFGVDNGIFVWLDGVFLGGQLRPGGSVLGEFVLAIGNLSAGTHFLQVLREDHGGSTGYAVLVEGDAVVPLPAALPLYLSGLAAVGFVARRRKANA